MKGAKEKPSVSLVRKPPVVVILGHIDHGKTTLLDYIRKTNFAAKEVGGITQRIGAYQTKFKVRAAVRQSANSGDARQSSRQRRGSPKTAKFKVEEKTITFIDTPGHEAFTQMRSRGAKVADLAILIVAANDGVMPQTKESIKYIKQAQTPFLVAINKMDLVGVSAEKVKGQLAENDILVEGYGGDIISVPISAKTGQGVDELLEMVLLLAEMEELKTDPKGKFRGIIIESKLDRRKGPLATVLVQNGTLKVGDVVEIEGLRNKIRAMFDEDGKKVKKAEPATPVEILGLKEPSPVGGKVTKPEEKITTLKTQKAKPPAIEKEPPKIPKPQSVTKTPAPKDTEKKLKIILKADTVGSLEAILGSFSNDVLVLHFGVGDVHQNDVNLAKIGKAQIFTFNVKIPSKVKKLVQIEKVKIHQYQVIYKLLEEIEKQVLKILEPTIDEKIIGKAKIIAEFEIKGTKIAGARVTEGKIPKSEKIHLQRDSKIIGNAKISSMRHEKEDVNEAKIGQEFGAVFSTPLDFKIGDVIMSYRH